MQNATFSKIAKTRESIGLSREEWRHSAIFMAILYRDFAPKEIRLNLYSKPSNIPQRIIFISEVFLSVLLLADARARCAGIELDPAECWKAALQIAEGSHER